MKRLEKNLTVLFKIRRSSISCSRQNRTECEKIKIGLMLSLRPQLTLLQPGLHYLVRGSVPSGPCTAVTMTDHENTLTVQYIQVTLPS